MNIETKRKKLVRKDQKRLALIGYKNTLLFKLTLFLFELTIHDSSDFVLFALAFLIPMFIVCVDIHCYQVKTKTLLINVNKAMSF